MMTTTEFLNRIVETSTDAEMVEKANALIAARAKQTDSRKAKSAEKKAAENEPVKAAIAEALTDEPTLAAVIAEKVEITPAKATAMLRQMVAEGRAHVTDVKVPKAGMRKAYTL